jgi:hypothetical protein
MKWCLINTNLEAGEPSLLSMPHIPVFRLVVFIYFSNSRVCILLYDLICGHFIGIGLVIVVELLATLPRCNKEVTEVLY